MNFWCKCYFEYDAVDRDSYVAVKRNGFLHITTTMHNRAFLVVLTTSYRSVCFTFVGFYEEYLQTIANSQSAIKQIIILLHMIFCFDYSCYCSSRGLICCVANLKVSYLLIGSSFKIAHLLVLLELFFYDCTFYVVFDICIK